MRIALSLRRLTYRDERMRFCLGKKEVRAINDGSIVIKHSKGIWSLRNEKKSLKCVVSLEVFSSFFPANICRPNEKGKVINGLSPVKYSAKCWLKSVIQNSILSIQMNTWKHDHMFSDLILGVCHPCTTYSRSILLLEIPNIISSQYIKTRTYRLSQSECVSRCLS